MNQLLQNVNVTTRYTVNLISVIDPVVYRPFTVGEQKSLKVASELGESSSLNTTVMELLTACTFNEVDVKTLPSFDVETLFLKIRSVSVGDTIEFGLKCKQCETVHNTTISISDDIKTVKDENHTNEIYITDDVKLVFDYPNMDMINHISDGDEIDQSIELFARCLNKVYDIKNENVYEDLGVQTKKDFVNSLSAVQIEKIRNEFFDSMPKNKSEINFTCKECETENKIVIEDTESFFQ